jgi:hypothetical protein
VRHLFGFVFTLIAGVVLLVCARKLGSRGVALVLMMLGLTSALYALLDIRSDILSRPGLESDAHMLANMPGIPTLIWGFLWIGVAAVASFFALRRWLRRA